MHFSVARMMEPIITERLVLNALTEEDHAFMLELLNSKGWLQFIGDRNVRSTEDSVNYIRRIKNTNNFPFWVVRLKDGQVPIGIISFLKRPYLDQYDIGFAFLPQHHGRGYAYEAAHAVLTLVQQSPEHSTIIAITLPGNEHSINLLKKLGMRFEKEVQQDQEVLHQYTTDPSVVS